MSAIAARAAVCVSRTDHSSDGSATSTRWCGTASPLGDATAWPCRCPCPGTPASSRARRSRRRRARAATASATADFPDAVGPTIARWRVTPPRPGCAHAAGARASPAPTKSARRKCGAALVIADRRPARPDRVAVVGHEVHELVLAGAPRPHRRVLLRRPLDQELLGATDPRLRACATREPSTTSTRRCMRSCTTSGATKSSVISAASVPGRGENTNV